MKTKEEIVNKWLEEDVYGEPLSELDLNECGEIEFRGLKSGFISGYTQCQEDIINRKYTEEDMIKAIWFGMQKGLNVGKIDETDNNWVNNYINSLNKQD